MSRRYKGAVISSTAPDINTIEAKGIWTVRQNFVNSENNWPRPITVPTPLFLLNFSQVTALDNRISFSRGSPGSYYNSSGNLVVSGSNVPRFDHDPITNENLGVLIEDQRTNSCLRSEDIAQTVWLKQNLSVQTNVAVAPTGNTTAETVLETSTNGVHTVSQEITINSISEKFAFSIFVKSAGRSKGSIEFGTLVLGVPQKISCDFDLTTELVITGSEGTGVVDLAKIKKLKNGWFRIGLIGKTGQAGAHNFTLSFLDDSGNTSYAGDTQKGFSIWGAQVEENSRISSYIQTSASSATRNADLLVIDSDRFSSWFESSQGSFFAETRIEDSETGFSSGTPTIFEINDGTDNNKIKLNYDQPNNKINLTILDDSESILDLDNIDLNAFANKKARTSFSYGENKVALASSGKLITQSDNFIFPAMAQINLGSTRTGSLILNGHLSKIYYWNSQLDNRTLRYLSTNSYEEDAVSIFSFSDMLRLDSRLTLNRSSIGTFFNKDRVLETASSNLPRFDNDPLTGASLGILIERERTNIFQRSSDISDGYWTKNGTTVSLETDLTPDNSPDSQVLFETSDNALHQLSRALTIDSSTAPYTFSVFVKPKDRERLSLVVVIGSNFFTTNFNLGSKTITTNTGGTGEILANKIIELKNGWFRISSSGLTGSNGETSFIVRIDDDLPNLTYTGDPTKGIKLFGLQLEQGEFASSYIPTAAESVTRNSDILTVTSDNFSSWFDPAEGTVYWEGTVIGSNRSSGANQHAFTFSSGLSTDRLFVLANHKPTANQNLISRLINVESNVLTTLDSPSPLENLELGKKIKTVTYYKTNDFKHSLNGQTPSATSSGILPIVNKLNIGSDETTGGLLNGHVIKMIYWNKNLPDWRMKKITENP